MTPGPKPAVVPSMGDSLADPREAVPAFDVPAENRSVDQPFRIKATAGKHDHVFESRGELVVGATKKAAGSLHQAFVGVGIGDADEIRL